MKFTTFNFNDELLKGINNAGFTEIMPVQEKVFTQIQQSRDIVVQSQTGTGKTAAFLISIFHHMLRAPNEKALVIAPTRELAAQIEEEAKLIGRFLPFKTVSFFGGVGYNRQEKQINEGVDIIVGTPGRLLDLNQSGKLKLNAISILVIDEADRLFDMGFYPDLKKILRQVPKYNQRKTMLFSATLPVRIRNLAWEFMNSPVEVIIEPERITVEEISQELYHVAYEEKFSLLLGIIKSKNPKSALIFTNTKIAAVEVSNRLKYNGVQCHYIMGDLPQKQRLQIIGKAKSGKTAVLVATDVAARGLHIDDLELVVNYDVPEDCENYVHRIGRTARAGKSGKAITLVCERFVYGLPAIESFLGKKIPVTETSDSLYHEDDSVGKINIRDKYLRASKKRLSTRTKRNDKTVGKNSNRKRRPDLNKRTSTATRRPDSNIKRSDMINKKSDNSGVKSINSNTKPDNNHKNTKNYNQYQKNNDNGRKETGVRKSSNNNKIKKLERGKNRTQEERLNYYKEKYGENFKMNNEIRGSEQSINKKESLFGKLKKLFSKKQ